MTYDWGTRCPNPSTKETEVGRAVGVHNHVNSDALHPLKSRYCSVLEHYQGASRNYNVYPNGETVGPSMPLELACQTGPITYNNHEKVTKDDEDEDNGEDIMSELDDLSRLVYDLNIRDYAKYLAAIGEDKPGSIPSIEGDDYDWQDSSIDYAGSVYSIESCIDDELFDFSQDLVYCSYQDSMEPSLCSSDLEESPAGRFATQEM